MMHRFSIRAIVDPQALPRVTDQLARQWVTPARMEADQFHDEIHITVEVCDLPAGKAQVIEACLASCPLILSIECKPVRCTLPFLAFAHH